MKIENLTVSLWESEKRRERKPSGEERDGGRRRWKREAEAERKRHSTISEIRFSVQQLSFMETKGQLFLIPFFKFHSKHGLSERCWVRLAVQRELLQTGAREPNTLTLEIQMQ